MTRLREPVERKKKKHKAAAPVSDEPEVGGLTDEAEAGRRPEPEAVEEETE